MKEPGRSQAKAVSWLCSLGLFLAGYVFYSSSLIEPFYTADFLLTNWQIGIAQSAVPLGAILGAILAGRLADLLGRHRLLIWSFFFVVIAGLAGGFVFNFHSLCFARTLNGFLAGTLYPLCAAYLTEMTPHASLSRQSAVLMFVNCLAAPVACLLAIVLTYFCNASLLWHLLISFHALPACIAYLWLRNLPESEAWLHDDTQKNREGSLLGGIKILFNPTYRQITFCLMGAWFLMDVAYYGINFFIPYLLQVIEAQILPSALSPSSLLSQTTLWGTLLISLFFMVGAFAAIFVVEKIDLFKLQQYGFLLSSMSLVLLAFYFHIGLHAAAIIILLFILFNVALNIGPDVTTYLLSATAYPVEIRASGHGTIAGFAKFGSFLGVLLLPQLQHQWGHETVILLLALLLFTAYLLTINLSAILTYRDVTEAEVSYETY